MNCLNCPECQSPIEETHQFCHICGVKLQRTCPGCKSIIAPSDRFCGECGLESEISKSPARKRQKNDSECKYITVLFADISGYTTLSERLDPE